MEAPDPFDRGNSPHLLRHNDAADHDVDGQQRHAARLPGNDRLPAVEQAEGDGSQGGDVSLQGPALQQWRERFV